MKKQTTIKIISRLIIFVFVVSFFQFSLPIQAVTDNSMSGLYFNPNRSDFTYKFKISDVVNSQMLTNVVGCTGVVNKTATWMSKFISSPIKQTKILIEKLKQIKNGLKSACSSTKAGAQSVAGVTPMANDLVSTVDTIFSKISIPIPSLTNISDPTKLITPSSNKEKVCLEQVESINPDQLNQMVKDAEAEEEKRIKEQCFDGIAITLAKNQLTAMTRSMMNWVNSGFGGNPFFVQNIRNFTYNIEKNIVETGTDILLDKAFGGKNKSPYADDFARSYVGGRGIVSGSANFLGGLKSDLGAFITDPTSIFTDNQLDKAMDTRNALQRAQDANYAFQNDFSSGGWNGWLALTQRDQNNPLGFTMLASQYLAEMQAQGVTEAKDELAQNDGFMSQKTCILWKVLENGSPVWDEENNKVKTTNNPRTAAEKAACSEWKVITPGTLIAEKTKVYLNSPERQLELVKTINDGLNFLFSSLLSKLEGGGLAGLSDNVENKTNWTDNMNEFTGSEYTSPDGNTPYSNNGAYDGFNLTSDLGNNYIYDTPIELGTWNANTNEAKAKTPDPNPIYLLKKEANGKIKLYPDTAPEVYQVPINNDTIGDIELSNDLYGNLVNPKYGYYKVTTAGKTKLINEGYNGWAKDDRAFWNGKEWQNWKKGQVNPIEKRGVIQTQQDYIVAAKEILGVLPNVMTNLGELDYCLPGPNPSYKTNSTDAQSAYQDWIGSMYVGPRDANRDEWKIDHEDTRTYNNLANIFADNQNTWEAVLNSPPMSLLNDFDRNWLATEKKSKKISVWAMIGAFLTGSFIPVVVDNFTQTTINTGDCESGGGTPMNCQTYHWHKDGKSLGDDEQADVDNRKKLMDETLDKVNNHLFQDFYKAFDEKMNKIYFNSMTNKYSDTEVSVGETPNSGYIPMAESGLDLTKNILYYNDDITKAMQDYTDAMTQAKINIAKLEPIKTEVSGIIKAAQDRRDANLLIQINKEGGATKDRTVICKSYLASCGDSAQCKTTYNKCIAANGKDLTIDLYKTIYKSCLAEENISFYDADDITAMKGPNAENCIDGIDNDLNGLVDCADSACKTNSACKNTGTGTTTVSTYYKLMSCGNSQTYSTGPWPSGTYSSGARVQGATNSFYVVTGSQTTPMLELTNIGTSGTGASGCPQ